MDSSFSPKDEIWFLRVCHHISNAVYTLSATVLTDGADEGGGAVKYYRGLTAREGARGPTMLHTFRYSKLSQKAIFLNRLL